MTATKQNTITIDLLLRNNQKQRCSRNKALNRELYSLLGTAGIGTP